MIQINCWGCELRRAEHADYVNDSGKASGSLAGNVAADGTDGHDSACGRCSCNAVQ